MMIWQLKDCVKDFGNKVVKLWVWITAAKKKQEEEWMFLKQRKCEKRIKNVQHLYNKVLVLNSIRLRFLYVWYCILLNVNVLYFV